MGDALAVETENWQSMISEAKDRYVYVFPKDDRYYRVEAEMTQELAEQLDAIDFFDEERAAKTLALIGGQPVVRVYDLSAGMPSQAELDTLIGKTGQELLDMGFEYGSGYSFWDKAEVYLEKGLYEYRFYFNEKVPKRENYDDDLDEIMKTITVARVEFFTVTSMASDPELVH